VRRGLEGLEDGGFEVVDAPLRNGGASESTSLQEKEAQKRLWRRGRRKRSWGMQGSGPQTGIKGGLEGLELRGGRFGCWSFGTLVGIIVRDSLLREWRRMELLER
jgi:hypothetical protein